jgi:hypothetical protein
MPEGRKRHKENDWKNVREVAWQHSATRHSSQRPSRLRYTNTKHIRERRRFCIPYTYVDLRFRTREKTVLYTIYDSEIYCYLLFEYLPARCPFEAVIFFFKFVVNFRHFVKKNSRKRIFYHKFTNALGGGCKKWSKSEVLFLNRQNLSQLLTI